MYERLYFIIVFKVELNWFGEKHGKSSRDQHFSIISVFLKNAEMTKQLKSTNDVIIALKHEQEKSNEIRLSNKLDKIQSIFLGNLFFICVTMAVFE